MRLHYFIIIFLFISGIDYSQTNEAKADDLMSSTDSIAIVPRINLDSIHFAPSHEMLDEEVYWTIIDSSLKETKSQEDQEIFLTTILEQLSPQEIVGFRLRTDKLMFDSYTSDLWCANYIISNGAAEDGFDYFRCWLISRGKEAYYKVQQNPDALIDLVENEPKAYDFEGFWYVAMNAFKNATNQEIYAYLDYENFKTTDENYPILEFSWNVDEPETMEKVCPVLFKKFWKK